MYFFFNYKIIVKELHNGGALARARAHTHTHTQD